MAAILDIANYWRTNNILLSVVPVQNVYFGLVPPTYTTGQTYASIGDLGDPKEINTGTTYIGRQGFTITLFSQSLYTVEQVADVVDGQFEKVSFNPRSIGCFQQNRLSISDALQGLPVYQVILTYRYLYNGQLPS